MFSRPFPSPSQESGRVETAVRLSLLVHRLLPDGPIRTCAQPLIHCPPLTAHDFKKWKSYIFPVTSSISLYLFMLRWGKKSIIFAVKMRIRTRSGSSSNWNRYRKIASNNFAWQQSVNRTGSDWRQLTQSPFATY